MLREMEIDVFFNFPRKLSLNHMQYRQMRFHTGSLKFHGVFVKYIKNFLYYFCL